MAVTNRAKDASVEALHKAVRRLVRCYGGTAVVTGGIEILQWPGSLKYQYSVSMRVTGKPPTDRKDAQSAGEELVCLKNLFTVEMEDDSGFIVAQPIVRQTSFHVVGPREFICDNGRKLRG